MQQNVPPLYPYHPHSSFGREEAAHPHNMDMQSNVPHHPSYPHPLGTGEPSHSQNVGMQSPIPLSHPSHPYSTLGAGEPSHSQDPGMQSSGPHRRHRHSSHERRRPSTNRPTQRAPHTAGFQINVESLEDPFVEPGSSEFDSLPFNAISPILTIKTQDLPRGDPTMQDEQDEIDSIDAMEETFKTPSPDPGEHQPTLSRSWIEGAFHGNQIRNHRRDIVELRQRIAEAYSDMQYYEEEIRWLEKDIQYHLGQL